jgi:hypothetical protein
VTQVLSAHTIYSCNLENLDVREQLIDKLTDVIAKHFCVTRSLAHAVMKQCVNLVLFESKTDANIDAKTFTASIDVDTIEKYFPTSSLNIYNTGASVGAIGSTVSVAYPNANTIVSTHSIYDSSAKYGGVLSALRVVEFTKDDKVTRVELQRYDEQSRDWVKIPRVKIEE